MENIPEGPVTFAATHQGILDSFVWISNCPKYVVLFHGAETNKLGMHGENYVKQRK